MYICMYANEEDNYLINLIKAPDNKQKISRATATGAVWKGSQSGGSKIEATKHK